MENTIYPSVIDVVVDAKLPYFVKSYETLIAQTVQDFELVLVVGYPGTEVRAFMAEQEPMFKLTIVQEPPREKYPCRASANNLGMDAASGNLYIGTQDDILYPPNWVESHIEHHKGGGPYFVMSRVVGALTGGTQAEEDEFWSRISDTMRYPSVMRWQYASGHSFSLPMGMARKCRHNELYNGFWGFEDIQWAYDCFNAGCEFVIDTNVAVVHQDHGDRQEERWASDQDGFWQWLSERSRNRRLFYGLNGFEPETGIVLNEFGLPGMLDYTTVE